MVKNNNRTYMYIGASAGLALLCCCIIISGIIIIALYFLDPFNLFSTPDDRRNNPPSR